MKLRSLQEFEDAIDRETAWRKRELSTVLSQARAARTPLQPTALRSGVALLYAHWEGWIKRVAEMYIDFVGQQRLAHDQLSAPFLALALKVRISDLIEAKSVGLHVAFAEFLQADLSTRARLVGQGHVRTESNLSSAVLRDIVDRLGLDYQPYELQKQLIDQRMVETRNHVAHGEYLDVSLADFETLHDEVSRMLRVFTADVLNHAALKNYRAPGATIPVGP
ncbi:MAG TPA: MAE_28990/MAE_18760 family HEPN-like nuclease [Baekduia sp.]|uniref:MAE_28990/MAE_18760 family HEPN-like nuclease n=1 Tax=Baekduia sp. TaxID=2600305 RepID=UPI002D7837CE|nr:MAE_28990/MAE_18760 family HEPN-like nuclease [Baekduia sp.]HET6509575.1 MAE_28990/MAE_18760 family HEPN-like nuclease [Baekduia sp.]